MIRKPPNFLELNPTMAIFTQNYSFQMSSSSATLLRFRGIGVWQWGHCLIRFEGLGRPKSTM